MRQTELLIELLDEAGFDVGSPRDTARRGGTVTRPDAGVRGRAQGARRAQILCDFRPDAGLRLGPHYYNSDDEKRRILPSTRSRKSCEDPRMNAISERLRVLNQVSRDFVSKLRG